MQKVKGEPLADHDGNRAGRGGLPVGALRGAQEVQLLRGEPRLPQLLPQRHESARVGSHGLRAQRFQGEALECRNLGPSWPQAGLRELGTHEFPKQCRGKWQPASY